MLLSHHPLKTTGCISPLLWAIIRKQQKYRQYTLYHNLRAFTHHLPLTRIYPRLHFASSGSKIDDEQISDSKVQDSTATSHNNEAKVTFSRAASHLSYIRNLLNGGSTENVNNAEKFLFDRLQLDADVAPSQSYEIVLEAWCKMQKFDRAELLLDQIHYNYINKQSRIAPNAYQFIPMMYGYNQSLVREGTKGKHHEYATKIENLFQKMIEWNEEFGYKTKPQSRNYAVLFESMRYSDRVNPEKAETIFRVMLKRYADGELFLKPTTKHIKSILFLWYLSKHEDAADRSLALFTEAKNRSIKLDTFCYDYMIRMQGDAGQNEITETIYDEMITLFKAGDQSMKPRMETMTTILTVRSKTGNPIGAQQIFNEMLKECKDGNWIKKPTILHFSLLLMAWYNSGLSNTGEKAHEMVRKLNQIADASPDFPIRPNSVSYSIVIKCYNRSNQSNLGKCLVNFYNEMKEQKHVQPDLILYYEFLTALMKSYANHANIVDGKDVVNTDTHNDEVIVDTIKQILFKDVYEIPVSIWQQEQDGGGVWFCSSIIWELQKYNIPESEELLSHIKSKLQPKAEVRNKVIV